MVRCLPLAPLIAILALLVGPAGLGAQTEGTIVDSIAVAGNSRLARKQIIDFSGIAVFVPINFRGVQKAIQALYRTGQFDDVSVEQRDAAGKLILAIVVKERPVLQHWVVRGTEKLDENEVKGKVSLPEGRPIDRASVERSRHNIDSLYRKKGFYTATVKVIEEPATNNATRIVFDIKEGNRVNISQVVFHGNKHFKAKDIVLGLDSKPEGFWWYQKGEYSEEKVEQDVRDRLPTWYADRGYIDFQVTGDSLVPDSSVAKATLILNLDEGQQYKVGTFELIGNRRFSADEIATIFPFGLGVVAGSGKSVGVPYNRAEWQTATGKLDDQYKNFGYIYGSVQPEEIRRTGKDGTSYIDLRWSIREGSPATINKIEIVGNDVTHERVIREAIVLLPGEVFNRERLIRSYQNVSNLNFFQQPIPSPDVRPAENNQDVDIVFRVEEKKTGNINFGASLGQGTGVGGFIGLEEPNLFGKAKRGRLQWQFGANINDFNLSYTDPAVKESRISSTINLFNSRQRFTVGDLGRRRQEGGSLQLGFPFLGSRYTRLFGSYTFSKIQFTDGSADLRARFRCNNCTRSAIAVSLARDTRIGLPFPIAGSSTTITTEVNGGVLGGTGQYQKIDLEGKWYTPLGRLGGTEQFSGGVQFVLGLTAKSGFVVGDPGPFFTELYSMGGVQFGVPLRGYQEFSITPNGFDPTSTGSSAASPDAFGKAYAAFTVEAGARISQALYVDIFSDAGNVYRRAREYNPTRLFRSVGLGVALVSPLGPIGVDLGYGLDRVDANGKPNPAWQLHFRLGNFF